MNGSPAFSLFGLSGRVALVTGGNGGIGLAMATGLAKMGARIVIAGRSEEKAAAALAKLRVFTPTPRFQAADMANADACAALVDGVRQREGRIDILINNAGTTARKRPEDLGLDEWKAVIDINLTSAFVCSKAAFPAMKANGGGKIINIGSMFSLFGAPFAAAYGASKGGLMQLTRSLATAWAPDNIQVNAVLPGWVETEMGSAAQMQVQGLRERVVARTPAGRWGRGEDYEGIAAFLAGPASDFITGTAIAVDGGFSISG